MYNAEIVEDADKPTGVLYAVKSLLAWKRESQLKCAKQLAFLLKIKWHTLSDGAN